MISRLRTSRSTKTCRKHRFERLEVVIRLSMNTGMRTGEIIWLDWRDVDLVNGWVHVTSKRGWSPKSNAERSIPISEEFAAWLKRHKERLAHSGPNDLVVPITFQSNQRWNRRLLTRRLTDLLRAAGVEVPGSRHKLHLIRYLRDARPPERRRPRVATRHPRP